NRGVAQSCLGESEKAIASFDSAITLKPDCYEAINNRGVAQSDLGEFKKAIASFDSAITLKQDNWESWIGRGNAAGKVKTPESLSPFTSAIAIQNPALNQRGYQGELTSYQEGLKYVDKDTAPEGWGRLHREIGSVHYRRWQSNTGSFTELLSEAIESYNLALQTLTQDAFPEGHLEVLQDLIEAYRSSGQTAEAQRLQQDARDLLRRLLAESKSPGMKQLLAVKFAAL
ncbi:tetratricopeptide repeat protein, partial [Microcoleus sp. ARI1-A1]